jgi:hypothetical protein
MGHEWLKSPDRSRPMLFQRRKPRHRLVAAASLLVLAVGAAAGLGDVAAPGPVLIEGRYAAEPLLRIVTETAGSSALAGS